MNREQAEEILDYLLHAAYELDEAKAAAAVLEDQDEDAAAISGARDKAQFRAAAGDF